MDRQSAKSIFDAVEAVQELLNACPHGVAKQIETHLSNVVAIANDVFPGGYAGECIYCDESMGDDERISVGDEYCCPKCWGERVEEMRSCTHDLKPDRDDFGDPHLCCNKCGYAEPVEAAQGA